MNLKKVDTLADLIELVDIWVLRKNILKEYMYNRNLSYYDRLRASNLYVNMVRRITALEKFNGKLDLKSVFY